MASEPTKPLRVSRNSVASPPSGMASPLPRALTEISPAEKRRNSPSWNQPTKKMTMSTDSSPFQSSPLEVAATTTSPHLFWKNKNLNSENSLYGARNGSPSPTRRSSIERLQKASRVKNSNILALEQKQEYDPTRVPQVERPLSKVQGNAYGGTGAAGLRNAHQRAGSKSSIPLYSPTRAGAATPVLDPPRTPSKDQASPIKSSLSTSRFKSSHDSSMSVDRDLPNGRYYHRHAKSVTFDAAPPQVNEYEMATPDISSIGSNSREGSYESGEDNDGYDDHYGVHDPMGPDDSFDASLEDTDKTPVVGPDDWRHDSPAAARSSQQLDDPFDGSPMPEVVPSTPSSGRPQNGRNNSATSLSGDHRPLPPLPGMAQPARPGSSASNGRPGTAGSMQDLQRSLPSPPSASASKSDVQNIGNGRMPLEERLKLMMLSGGAKTAAEQQRERRMRRAGARDRIGSPTPEREIHNTSFHEEEDDAVGDISGLEEYQLPPRISRESILRRVNGNQTQERESDYRFSSPPLSSSPARPERTIPMDPDVPIPSTEDSMLDLDGEEEESSVIIHRREHDDEDNGEDDDDDDEDEDDEDDEEFDDDAYDIPELYAHGDAHREPLDLAQDHSDDEDISLDIEDDSSRSRYSDEPVAPLVAKASVPEEDVSTTPRATTPVHERVVEERIPEERKEESALLPEVPQSSRSIDFSRGLQEYMLPKPIDLDGPMLNESKSSARRTATPEKILSKPEYDGSGWGDDDDFSEPSTPDSVIHHPVSDVEEEPEEGEEESRATPDIPEHVATIKASGSRLKTRPSNTPSDLAAMRDARRQVSREIPDVPAIPARHASQRDVGADLAASESEAFLERHPSFKKRSLTLDLDLGLSLDQDFDRVIETQKRGYLMRQNTKVVTATDKERDEYRFARSAGNSPIKQDRPQSWTVEPWNGQVRKKSVRKRTALAGPAPPLPGQESNVAGLNPHAEEELVGDATAEDSGERGRLFVKVMGVKDLDLPLPKNERSWFSLTLDNGVHCVTTAWLELARNAPIGQEFELVVPNDLEFQLTLNVKLEKPAPQQAIQSPTKLSRPKTSTFSRVFASPKKRKEMEMRMREEEERLAREQQEAQARLRNRQPTPWDLLSPLAAEDGSFARSYVCLKEHESRCYGRPYLVDVSAFNEWATEEAGFASSVKSKRGNTAQIVRRAPYKVGKLELQLLFVPRPKGASDDDMPKSMNSCIREMRAAEERLARNWEGPLSQQGGDCPYWRRRYFKLVGTKLTAYHEATRQPRATINLANAKRLIDDRRALTEKETTGRGGKRRRSAFAEDEEGYMFVEEGFRIRFNNGELIDFYADTPQDKEGWMKVLSEVIGRDSVNADDDASTMSARNKSKWCDLVLKREETVRRRTESRRVHSRTKSMYM
ncbi:hypothetical protein GGTG_03899 [Gaeumannomyces tritici R3-111a-1]|uniref:PH domain-containing protein n=1 Tax=Gaeumannomyces tritici (strain R3-111a-1) TaxID=644352 RepID=J3NRJ5_GAET3|nr:hypothetical protein GGTG_03899 [Gaeumannomyces tritici R3-111a-1]EJT78801.1 hypothetical protein GGTG_03899 [Gaeumannomyces tritici R3-111a-1]